MGDPRTTRPCGPQVSSPRLRRQSDHAQMDASHACVAQRSSWLLSAATSALSSADRAFAEPAAELWKTFRRPSSSPAPPRAYTAAERAAHRLSRDFRTAARDIVLRVSARRLTDGPDAGGDDTWGSRVKRENRSQAVYYAPLANELAAHVGGLRVCHGPRTPHLRIRRG